MRAKRRHGRQGRWSPKGFSLAELMITVAIAAILAAVAYPSFVSQIQKSRRAEAKASLLEVSQLLERCFCTFRSYNDANCAIGTALTADGVDSESAHYKVTAPTLTANTFTLTATPQGAQADDSRCTAFSLTHTGVKSAEGSDATNCW